ncbi:MAG: N-acetylneuraminate synthase family protein [Methyloprofundus sp.]|nr:N-acetylneuraminate synthase family protein [Methyloprofundus sp.]
MTFYLYAETAFHHEGDKDYLFKLIDEAKEAGCHGVKFQVLIELNEFMSSKHAAYSQVKNWLFSFNEWVEVLSYTKKQGLDIVLMPLDIEALKLVELFDVKYIEVHSVSFNDLKLLTSIKGVKLPLVFGVGGRTAEEIDRVVKQYNDRNVVLMVGYQSFPSELVDIKLERISALLCKYPDCQLGYADHSSFDDEMAIISNDYAYVLGARIFEKHIAIEEGKERTDWQSAVSGDKIKRVIERLNYLSKVFGWKKESLFEIDGKEKTYRDRQKVPVATVDIAAGTIVSDDLISLKMTSDANIVDSTNLIVGKELINNIEKDKPFSKQDFL